MRKSLVETDMVEIHIISVGCGNMTLIKFPNGETKYYDCNITEDNEDAVFSYLRTAMGNRRRIHSFVCSHRDADHMRGIKKLHAKYPVDEICDSGVAGTTIDSTEYREYMDLRRKVGSREIKPRTYNKVGDGVVRWMNSKDDGLSGANDQSIVMKVEYNNSTAMLTGDTTHVPWKKKILQFYGEDRLRTNILLGAHHGSATFFNDPPSDEYTTHIRKILPEISIISVGPNTHGLPDREALRLYKKYSTGSNQGDKVFRTDKSGNMKLLLKGRGAWKLFINQ